jgi:hypothetical protein
MKTLSCATAVLVLAGLVSTYGPARAAEPTQADFDACNREAQALTPSASVGPASAPASTSTMTNPSIGTGAAVSKSAMDPSLRGMGAEGLTDPAYQQAYRDCLTRRGF